MSAVWKEHGPDEYVLVSHLGQIMARIRRINGYWNHRPSEWDLDGKRYVTLEQAKAAAGVP